MSWQCVERAVNSQSLWVSPVDMWQEYHLVPARHECWDRWLWWSDICRAQRQDFKILCYLLVQWKTCQRLATNLNDCWGSPRWCLISWWWRNMSTWRFLVAMSTRCVSNFHNESCETITVMPSWFVLDTLLVGRGVSRHTYLGETSLVGCGVPIA